MAKSVKIGDVFSVVTSKGIALAQLTHKNKQYGYLIRVFPLACKQYEIDLILQHQPILSSFFPLQAAINQGLFTIVGNKDVPEVLKDFPVFRCNLPNIGIKKKDVSWLWDGEKSIKRDRVFNEIEKTYPVREIITAALLIERIETRTT